MDKYGDEYEEIAEVIVERVMRDLRAEHAEAYRRSLSHAVEADLHTFARRILAMARIVATESDQTRR